jgi:hypothetical protein
MVEIPTPKPYIFMIRVTRQIKCLIAQALGVQRSLFSIKDYMYRVRYVTYTIKIEKASEMQQPSCKSKLFDQTGFLFSRYINVMCQVSIFWHCWFTRRRFLNIKIINDFRSPSLDPRHTEHKFGRGSPKEHLGKVWLKLTKWFPRYCVWSFNHIVF